MNTDNETKQEKKRNIEPILRDLDIAQAMDDHEAVTRLTAELKDRIDNIFHANG